MRNQQEFGSIAQDLESLFEATHEGVWEWNIETNAMKFSHSWCRSLGYEPSEVPRLFSFYERLVHPDDLPRVQKELKAHLDGHTPIFESENRLIMKSGNWRWNLDRGKVVAWNSDGQPTRVLGVGMDISARKRGEERENLQRKILEKAAQGNSLPELLNDLCLQVEMNVPCSICSVMLLDKDSGALNVVAAPQALESACAVLNGTVPGEFSGACGTAAYTGEPVIITDTEQDPRWDGLREAARPLGIKACWSIPIFSEGKKTLGTFAISHPEVRHPTKFDLQLLETASSLAGVIIQLIQGKAELKKSEDRYRILYEDNPTMYFTVCSEGTVLSVNQFGAQQLGYTVDELIGQPVLKVFFKADQPQVQEQMSQCLQNPEKLGRWQFRKIRKDGSLLWVRETVRVVKLAHDQPVLFIVCEDITEQKHMEEMLHSSKEAIRELYEVTSSPVTTFEHRIRSLLELGCRRFNLAMGLLTRVHEDTLVVQYAHPSDGIIKEGTIVPLCHSFCQSALKSSEPIMVEHASMSEWRTDPGYSILGLESYLGMKVIVDEEAYGTLCFFGKELHETPFTEADKDFLMLMTRWVEGELERYHAEEALRINEQTIRDLYDITSARGMTFDHRVQALLKLGCRRFQLPTGVLTHLHGETLTVEAAYGSSEEFPIGASAPVRGTLCKQTLDAGQPVAFERVDATLSEASSFAGHKKIRTYIGTPVRVGNTVFGTFYFLSIGGSRNRYSKADTNFLQLMAQWLGNEFERQQDEASIKNMNLALSKAMPAISKLNRVGQFVEVNAEYAKTLGYDPPELIGLSWERTVYPEDLPIPLAAYQTMVDEGQSEFESRAVRKDGSMFYKHVMLVKEFDQHGNHVGHHCFMRDITDRKFSEEALRESEARLQGILDNSSAVIYVKDLEGKYQLINRKYETLFCQTREAVKGKTDFDIFPDDIAKAFTENDHKVLEGGEPLEREEVAPHDDGLHTYISNKFLLRHANGTPYAVCGISTDITQRKESEKNTRLHNHILESSPNGILITDCQQANNPVIFCNAAFEKITGYSLDEIQGRNCRFLQGNDTDQEGLHHIRSAIEAQEACQVVLRNYKKDGTLFWNDLKLAPVFNDQGELTNYIGVLVDITERKSLEDAFRALAETAVTLTGKDFLRFIVKTLAQCLNVKYAFIAECTDSSKDILRTLAFWNGAGFDDNFEYFTLGTPCEAVIRGEICYFPHRVQDHFPDDKDLKSMEVESYVGYPLQSQFGEIFGHLVAMDTQSLPEESKAIPIIKLLASRAAAELERDKAEKALRRSEGRLRQVVDLVPQLIFAKDKEGRFILCNEALANLYGTTVPALIGKTDADFAQSQQEADQFRRDDLEVIESGKVKVIKEEQITDTSGKLHYLHTTKIPFVFADTTLPSVLGVSTDITEQKTVESQLRKSYERTRELTARLEAAEESERKRIARELHDEFGQMLTGLKFDTAWLNRHLAKEKGVASLQPYLNKLKGMASLLDQTIQSVRRIATSLRPSILDDLGLIPALEWQAQEFQGRTGVHCQLTTPPTMVNTVLEPERATALFRIAQELLSNVMRHAEASKVKLDLRQENNHVILTIQDDGRGIADREIGHGTTLGLLGIKERIAPFGGKFLIRGKPGKGTRATVYIPLS